MKVTIHRATGPGRTATIGILSVDGEPKLLTLEKPWVDNQASISCIPAGTYQAQEVRHRITTGGTKIERTFQVKDVPKRAGILFHVGNSIKDTQGCILVGKKIFDSMVLDSKVAFAEFLDLTKNVTEFELEIIGVEQ